jgi:DNA-binding transcriptional MerR regulator
MSSYEIEGRSQTQMSSTQEKLLTIKEFSTLAGIEESTLRYWDHVGLFQPILRHEGNNYRYYSMEQAVAVDFITVLSSLKMPLKMIGEAKKNRDPQKILSMLRQQGFEIDKELIRLQEIYSTIHILQDVIHQGINATPGEIVIRHLDKMAVVIGPENTFRKDELFYRAQAEYRKQARHNRVNINNPIGGYHPNFEHFTEDPSRPQRFFSIDPTGCDCRPEGKYLLGCVQGYYGQMGSFPGQMAAYMKENGLVCEGPVYVIYLLDEISIQDPNKYLAQICVRVRTRKNTF